MSVWLCLLLACGGMSEPLTDAPEPPPAEQGPSFKVVSVDDLLTARASGDAAILDVRRVEQQAAEPLEEAVFIPIEALSGQLGGLAEYRNRPLYVICQNSTRSGIAATLLASEGFRDVRQVRGGWAELKTKLPPR